MPSACRPDGGGWRSATGSALGWAAANVAVNPRERQERFEQTLKTMRPPRIGVLTGGGDVPGLNYIIKSVD